MGMNSLDFSRGMKMLREEIISIIVINVLIFGLPIGLLAFRKNYRFWHWFGLSSAAICILGFFNPGKIGISVFGILVGLGVIILLAFLPFRCPKCGGKLTNKEWKSRTCPLCGAIK
jgi:hypothetical protein